jgi:nucleotide-binding universal stress UspA family protein
MAKAKNILVPVHFSELSWTAVSYAINIARQHGSKIFILHVVEVVNICYPEYCIDIKFTEEISKQSIASAKESLRKKLEQFPEIKDMNVHIEVVPGLPYQEILNAEKENNIDLIVIGAHKKKDFISHFIGNVADKVARGAKCPVLLIKS